MILIWGDSGCFTHVKYSFFWAMCEPGHSSGCLSSINFSLQDFSCYLQTYSDNILFCVISFRISLHTFSFLNTNIKTNFQLSFSVSVLKNFTNFLPTKIVFSQLSVKVITICLGSWTLEFSQFFSYKKQCAVSFTLNSMTPTNSAAVHKCVVLSSSVFMCFNFVSDLSQILVLFHVFPPLDKFYKMWRQSVPDQSSWQQNNQLLVC